MNNQKFLKDLEKSMAQYTAVGDIINRQSAMLASVGKQLYSQNVTLFTCSEIGAVIQYLLNAIRKRFS